jgi:uncharacterized membrane protein (UPF0127 family)
MRRAAFLFVIMSLAGCSHGPPADAGLQEIRLPGGRTIRAEVMTRSEDLMRGMMFRESLAPDRGMLFVHTAPGRYTYWMFQCLIPLDIIWLDANRRIVEISADTPPCKTEASDCPHYGGNQDSLFVLELAGGMAAKYDLKLGNTIVF